MRGNIQVIGINQAGLRTALELALPGVVVREAATACEAESSNVDVVVIATTFPLEEFEQVRVHPFLYRVPVVLVAPGYPLPQRDWSEVNAWATTATGPELLKELTGVVAHLLTRADHPSAGRRHYGYSARAS